MAAFSGGASCDAQVGSGQAVRPCGSGHAVRAVRGAANGHGAQGLVSLQHKHACTFAALYDMFESGADSRQPLRSGSGAPLAKPLKALRSI